MNINLSSASRIANLQNSSMQDICTINTSASYTDSYGQVITSFTSGSLSASSICGYRTAQGGKSYSDQTVIYTYDAIFRLPLSVAINEKNTITLIQHNYKSVNLDYRIVNIALGNGEQIIKVNKVST